ncbi:MAG TPA: hypothetical protein VF666_05895 [Pyrinomonadaceae bacterium]|jgi:hypothetical protein
MKTYNPMNIFCAFLFIILLAIGASAQRRASNEQDSSRGQGGRRLAPPAAVTCPLDNLTVYEGRIIAYRRSASRTFIRIRTDADTTESVTLEHRRARSPMQWFLLRAEPFKSGNWKLIEVRNGRLRPHMRAHIWVCTDRRNPVVDWQPPQAE